jgi:hypothetical protein
MSSQPVTASPLDTHTAPVKATGKRSGRATAALVLGIIAVLAVLVIPLVGWILAVIAIVLGATARADIRRNNCLGAGQARAAIILGVVAILVGIAEVAIFASTR